MKKQPKYRAMQYDYEIPWNPDLVETGIEYANIREAKRSQSRFGARFYSDWFYSYEYGVQMMNCYRSVRDATEGEPMSAIVKN